MPQDGSSPVIGPLTREMEAVIGAFARPGNTTPYDVDDAVSNHGTAGSVVPLLWNPYWGRGTIRRVKIRKSDQTVFTPTLRLYLFNAAPVSAGGDNEAFSASLADCIGVVDVEMTIPGSDDAIGFANCDIAYEGETIYGLLQTKSAFVPANAETFTVSLVEYPG